MTLIMNSNNNRYKIVISFILIVFTIHSQTNMKIFQSKSFKPEDIKTPQNGVINIPTKYSYIKLKNRKNEFEIFKIPIISTSVNESIELINENTNTLLKPEKTVNFKINEMITKDKTFCIKMIGLGELEIRAFNDKNSPIYHQKIKLTQSDMDNFWLFDLTSNQLVNAERLEIVLLKNTKITNFAFINIMKLDYFEMNFNRKMTVYGQLSRNIKIKIGLRSSIDFPSLKYQLKISTNFINQQFFVKDYLRMFVNEKFEGFPTSTQFESQGIWNGFELIKNLKFKESKQSNTSEFTYYYTMIDTKNIHSFTFESISQPQIQNYSLQNQLIISDLIDPQSSQKFIINSPIIDSFLSISSWNIIGKGLNTLLLTDDYNKTNSILFNYTDCGQQYFYVSKSQMTKLAKNELKMEWSLENPNESIMSSIIQLNNFQQGEFYLKNDNQKITGYLKNNETSQFLINFSKMDKNNFDVKFKVDYNESKFILFLKKCCNRNCEILDHEFSGLVLNDDNSPKQSFNHSIYQSVNDSISLNINCDDTANTSNNNNDNRVDNNCVYALGILRPSILDDEVNKPIIYSLQMITEKPIMELTKNDIREIRAYRGKQNTFKFKLTSNTQNQNELFVNFIVKLYFGIFKISISKSPVFDSENIIFSEHFTKKEREVIEGNEIVYLCTKTLEEISTDHYCYIMIETSSIGSYLISSQNDKKIFSEVEMSELMVNSFVVKQFSENLFLRDNTSSKTFYVNFYFNVSEVLNQNNKLYIVLDSTDDDLQLCINENEEDFKRFCKFKTNSTFTQISSSVIELLAKPVWFISVQKTIKNDQSLGKKKSFGINLIEELKRNEVLLRNPGEFYSSKASDQDPVEIIFDFTKMTNKGFIWFHTKSNFVKLYLIAIHNNTNELIGTLNIKNASFAIDDVDKFKKDYCSDDFMLKGIILQQNLAVSDFKLLYNYDNNPIELKSNSHFEYDSHFPVILIFRDLKVNVYSFLYKFKQFSFNYQVYYINQQDLKDVKNINEMLNGKKPDINNQSEKSIEILKLNDQSHFKTHDSVIFKVIPTFKNSGSEKSVYRISDRMELSQISFKRDILQLELETIKHFQIRPNNFRIFKIENVETFDLMMSFKTLTGEIKIYLGPLINNYDNFNSFPIKDIITNTRVFNLTCDRFSEDELSSFILIVESDVLSQFSIELKSVRMQYLSINFQSSVDLMIHPKIPLYLISDVINHDSFMLVSSEHTGTQMKVISTNRTGSSDFNKMFKSSNFSKAIVNFDFSDSSSFNLPLNDKNFNKRLFVSLESEVNIQMVSIMLVKPDVPMSISMNKNIKSLQKQDQSMTYELTLSDHLLDLIVLFKLTKGNIKIFINDPSSFESNAVYYMNNLDELSIGWSNTSPTLKNLIITVYSFRESQYVFIIKENKESSEIYFNDFSIVSKSTIVKFNELIKFEVNDFILDRIQSLSFEIVYPTSNFQKAEFFYDLKFENMTNIPMPLISQMDTVLKDSVKTVISTKISQGDYIIKLNPGTKFIPDKIVLRNIINNVRKMQPNDFCGIPLGNNQVYEFEIECSQTGDLRVTIDQLDSVLIENISFHNSFNQFENIANHLFQKKQGSISYQSDLLKGYFDNNLNIDSQEYIVSIKEPSVVRIKIRALNNQYNGQSNGQFDGQSNGQSNGFALMMSEFKKTMSTYFIENYLEKSLNGNRLENINDYEISFTSINNTSRYNLKLIKPKIIQQIFTDLNFLEKVILYLRIRVFTDINTSTRIEKYGTDSFENCQYLEIKNEFEFTRDHRLQDENKVEYLNYEFLVKDLPIPNNLDVTYFYCDYSIKLISSPSVQIEDIYNRPNVYHPYFFIKIGDYMFFYNLKKLLILVFIIVLFFYGVYKIRKYFHHKRSIIELDLHKASQNNDIFFDPSSQQDKSSLIENKLDVVDVYPSNEEIKIERKHNESI